MQTQYKNANANLITLFKSKDAATQDILTDKIMVSYNILYEINSDTRINSLLKDSDISMAELVENLKVMINDEYINLI